MIVDRRIGLAHMLRNGARLLVGLFAWDVAVVLAFKLAHRRWMDQPDLPLSLIGSVLVLFLNVRNNAAYNRWWEARTLWGSVVNNARSFSRQVATYLDGDPALVRAMAAYPHMLRLALQGHGPDADVERLLPAAMAAPVRACRNAPNAILREIGVATGRAAAGSRLHPVSFANIDRILSDMANAQGGLERIRATPLAIQFSVLPRFLVRVFCLMLPLSMVQELGWITPFGSTLVGLLFLVLDEIGHDLENPFQPGPHAMPMRAMARTIEIDLLQSIGEAAPDPVEPRDGVLA